VLSAARTQDPNSASCQFFLMHGMAPHLDGQYSAFGETVMGLDVVDLIATTRLQGERPVEPQEIQRAIVVQKRPSWVHRAVGEPDQERPAVRPRPRRRQVK
jgi:peptidyl-prolyl cis-trans isomerase B (cyclophilin B)